MKLDSILAQLIDDKNRALYDYVDKAYKLSIKASEENNYGLYLIKKEATLYVQENKLSPASFAHELLHAYLSSKGVYFPVEVCVRESQKLNQVISMELCEHITNVMVHRKMFPLFIEMGYDEKDFLSDSHVPMIDYDTAKFLVNALYRSKFGGRKTYQAAILDHFIGKYFAARCTCFSYFDYSKELGLMRQSEPRLTGIIENLVSRWDNYDIEKEGDLDYDSCFTISSDFLFELEDWIDTIQISKSKPIW